MKDIHFRYFIGGLIILTLPFAEFVLVMSTNKRIVIDGGSLVLLIILLSIIITIIKDGIKNKKNSSQ